MKYIELIVKQRKYRLAQSDIQRIYMLRSKKRPNLPNFEDDDSIKMYSPAVTEASEANFSEVTD